MANEYRLTSFSLEALTSGAANARVTDFTFEVLHSGAANARVSSAALEVLRSLTVISSDSGFASILW